MKQTRKIILPLTIKFNTNKLEKFIKLYNDYIDFELALITDTTTFIKKKYQCNIVNIKVKNDEKLQYCCVKKRKILEIVVGGFTIVDTTINIVQCTEHHMEDAISDNFNNDITVDFENPIEFYSD